MGHRQGSGVVRNAAAADALKASRNEAPSCSEGKGGTVWESVWESVGESEGTGSGVVKEAATANAHYASGNKAPRRIGSELQRHSVGG